MLNYTRARAEDVRALAGAIGIGSGAGLLVGAAYLALSPASAPVHPVPATPGGAAVASADQGREVAAAQPAPSHTLRERFRLAGELTHAVARPFQFAGAMAPRTDQNCLAEAVYFEARGEGRDGQQAVAQVVLNRVRHPAFPKSICAVVHQRSVGGCQFSFACDDRQAAVNSVAWRRAETVAAAALHGAVMAAVGDATHFQTAHSSPFAGLLKVAQIGAHVFYRFSGHAGSPSMFRQTPGPSVVTEPTGRVRVEFAAFKIAPAQPAPAPAEPAPRQAEPFVQVAAASAAPGHAPVVAVASASRAASGGATPPKAADVRPSAEPAAAKPAVAAPSALAQS